MVSPSSLFLLNAVMVLVFVWFIGSVPDPGFGSSGSGGAVSASSSVVHPVRRATRFVIRSVSLPARREPAAAPAVKEPVPTEPAVAEPAVAEPAVVVPVVEASSEVAVPEEVVVAAPPASPVAPIREMEDEELSQEMEARAIRETPLEEDEPEEPQVIEIAQEAQPVASKLTLAPTPASVDVAPDPEPAPAPAAIAPDLVAPTVEELTPTGTTMEVYRQKIRAASVMIRAGKLSEGMAALDAVLALDDVIGEQRAWALYLQAKVMRRRGLHRQAIRLYGEAIDHDPPGSIYKNSLAWLLATTKVRRLRDPQAAVVLAREAVAEGGERGNYLDTLARAHFEAGDLAEAVKVQSRAVRVRPDQESFANRLSWYQQEWAARGAVLAGAP